MNMMDISSFFNNSTQSIIVTIIAHVPIFHLVHSSCDCVQNFFTLDTFCRKANKLVVVLLVPGNKTFYFDCHGVLLWDIIEQEEIVMIS